MRAVEDSLGISTLAVCAVAVSLTASVARTRLVRGLVDVLLAVEGAGLAVGGLLLIDDVSTWSWVVAPTLLAVITPIHVRVLFAGEGPFRT